MRLCADKDYNREIACLWKEINPPPRLSKALFFSCFTIILVKHIRKKYYFAPMLGYRIYYSLSPSQFYYVVNYE